MYELPYGNTQQLNLDWFIKRWKEFYEEWEQTKTEIDGALDEEVQKVEDAMEDLYAARDAAATSATAAAASAASASNDATIAANAATAAAASATLANTKATAAGLSEAAAALSASQAANDATAAATSASQASASASSATDSAQAAATSEQNIESIIEDAIQDATDAAVAEATADAEAAATAAESSASDAADSATAAAASATAADSSADDAADSATAAAGSATAAAGSASDAADSATAAAASAASIVVDSAMSDSSTNPVQNKVINGELTQLKTAIVEITPVAEAKGKVVTLADSLAQPVRKWETEIPYIENGITKLTATMCGKNLFGGDAFIAWLQEKSSVTVDTTARTVRFPAYTNAAISSIFKPNTQYTIIVTLSKNTGKGTNLSVTYEDNSYDWLPQVSAVNTKETVIFKTNKNKNIKYFNCGNSSGYSTVYVDETGIFEGDISLAEFEAYKEQKQEYTLGSAFYGGTLKATEGKLITKYDSDGSLLPIPTETSITPFAPVPYADSESNFIPFYLSSANQKGAGIQDVYYCKNPNKEITKNATVFIDTNADVSNPLVVPTFEEAIATGIKNIEFKSDYYGTININDDALLIIPLHLLKLLVVQIGKVIGTI